MVSFQINTEDLPLLEAFPYVGRKNAYNNSNWLELYQNLRKARRRCGMIERVMEKTVATVQARG